MTRAQMASFLARGWTARTGEELALGDADFALGDADFADVAGNVHADNIVRIASAGLAGGTSPGVYDPAGSVTRAQMGTFLARLLTMLVGEGHTGYPPADPLPIPEPPSDVGLRWHRVSGQASALEGDGAQVMPSVVAGGPDLAAAGHDPGRDAAAVWTSPDGRSWQRVPHDQAVFGDGMIDSVTVGGPGLLAVGSSHQAAAVWTSTDGRSWPRVPHDESVFGGNRLQSMRSVTAGGPGLVAVGRDWGRGAAAVWTSTDGAVWQRVAHDETVFGGDDRQFMFSVVAGGPGLVAVGSDLGREEAAVWTSNDGAVWQRVPHDETVFGGFGPQEMYSVTAGGPGLVAVGYDWGRDAGAVWTTP